MGARVKVALVGIGGYGDSYVTAMLQAAREQLIELVGVVDPVPHRCRHLDELTRHGVKMHPGLPGLYGDARPDLVMMATPIHLHASHTCYALEQGSHVLCEKPLAATVGEARRVVSSEALHGHFVAVGYQWSFSRTIQELKRDILAGQFGRPVRLKSIVFFPRGLDYFRRNDWAGRIKTDRGEPVYDSPANNAAAHYLHNMLYLLGPSRETSATPVFVQAELYRANEIENYDTAAIRCRVDCGAELLFYTSHCVPPKLGPIANYEFEQAVISYEAESGAGFIARFKNGRVKRYGEPNLERNQKMWQSIDAVRSGKRIACGPRAAMPHALVVAAAQASMPQIRGFPASMLNKEGLGDSAMICVIGLHAALVQCYDQGITPSEHGGLEWSQQGKVIHLADTLNDTPFDLEEKHAQQNEAIRSRVRPADVTSTPQ